MEIRFSNDGPAFPAQLVDDFINGEVVFLCGAGVSAPQLPGFAGLLNEVYADLGVDATPAEKEAADAYRFEEAFGSLERRLSRPSAMIESVSRRLRPPSPNLENHLTLLRLARNLDDRVCLITTNFDTLFEQALERLDGVGVGKQASYASQSLPSPGVPDFGGIIHIHGRIEDTELGLSSTPLVLTSAAYGDVYMRSGGASRFLFDLLRCKTLVLIGYSAGDAPVRYFLNVLDADRQRFKDIRSVYAFDGVESHSSQSEARWSALAVTPLSYRKTRRGHAALWDDLKLLARLVESPAAVRRERAGQILSMPFASADEATKVTVKWLFEGKIDLLEVAVASIRDPSWFDFLYAERLVNKEDMARSLPSWLARGWTSHIHIETAVQWHTKLGPDFSRSLSLKLRLREHIPPVYVKAWDVIAKAAAPVREVYSIGMQVLQRVKSGNVSDSDLRAAIDCMRPVVTVKDRAKWSDVTKPPALKPAKLAELLWVEMRAPEERESARLRVALLQLPAHAERIFQLAVFAVRSVLYEARDVELVDSDWDRFDLDVPAVEEHAQNGHHYGLADLVMLTTTLVAVLAKTNTQEVKAAVEMLGRLPGKLGARLWLHCLRNRLLYSGDEVATILTKLSHDQFWGIRRELILALEERIGEASTESVAQLWRRIGKEGPKLFPKLSENGETDWRPNARSREMWLRLKAIDRAGALTGAGRTLLRKIAASLHIEGRDYEDRDLFTTYSFGVTYVAGNAQVLLSTPPEERLEKALSEQGAWDPDVQRNWSAYCAADPVGAFQTLAASRENAKNLGLWSDLIGAISWAPQNESDDAKAIRERVALLVFRRFRRSGSNIVGGLVNRLVDLWPTAPDLTWWDRLWLVLEGHEDTEKLELEDGERFYDRVINTAAGRHARHLILHLDQARQANDSKLVSSLMLRAEKVMVSSTPAGFFACGVFARDVSFLLSMDRRATQRSLLPKFNSIDMQGKVLRATLVEVGVLSALASRVFKSPILAAVAESRATGNAATGVAANLLRPLFLQAANSKAKGGSTAAEARQSLRVASPSILAGAAECMKQWVIHSEMTPEDSWGRIVKPIFQAVWPQEKSYRNSDCTIDLAATCVGAHTAFPDALSVIKHHLHPVTEEWVYLEFLTESDAPDVFPEQTLELLWLICGPGSTARSVDLPDVLGRIKLARGELAGRRRFQWLEQRAVRI